MIKIVAMADPAVPELHGDGLDSVRQTLFNVHQSLGYQFVPNYSSIAELMNGVRAIVAQNNDCLGVLEISAHGNPQICNGITLSNVAATAAALRTITLCDVVHVYLTGCNTGVAYQGAESIAQQFSRNTPTMAADNVRVVVHGTVGYASGTNAQGNAQCVTSCTTGTGKEKRFWDAYPPSGTEPGSQAASGAASFRAWVEGVPQ